VNKLQKSNGNVQFSLLNLKNNGQSLTNESDYNQNEMDKYLEQEFKDTLLKQEQKVSKKQFALDRQKIIQLADKIVIKKYGLANKASRGA
jgi:hypothetical protein